jgi:tryptophan-rich sensory protein
MSEIASRGQLRLAYLRWAMVTVPFILLLGFISARFYPAGSQSGWYVALTKPAMTPPNIAFPIAWTVIYILAGLAVAMILNARGARLRVPALILFAVQMVVNLAWSPVFFGLHQVTTALILLYVLAVLVLACIILFARIRVGAALLMVPYLAWICYAGVVLYQIDQLNPNAQGLVSSGSSDQIILN